MKKSELLELGVPEESIKPIMELHGKAIGNAKMKERRGRMDEAGKLREAIINMLPILKDPDNLRRILSETTYLYHQETRQARSGKRLGGENVPYYTECEKCGAKLDPGEPCDCEKAESEKIGESEVVTDLVTTEKKEEAAQ